MKLFRSRALYIVLLVLSTLILILVLLLRFVFPGGGAAVGGNRFERPGSFGGGSSEGSGMPEGFGDFTFPEGFDPSNMPQGAEGSNMPEGFDFSQFSEGGDMTGFPGGFDSSSFSDQSGNTQNGNPFGNMPGSRSGNKGFAFIESIRKYWIPIVSLCAFIDLLCVWMIVRLTKQKKEESKKKSGAKASTESEDAEPERKKPYWVLLLIPVLIAGIVLKFLPNAKKEETSSVSVKEKVLEAEATLNPIKTLYLSGGTLSEEGSVTYTLPGKVEIESYAVKNGDRVEEGDLIATVKKDSVLLQIQDLQAMMQELDSDLEKTSEDDSEELLSPADGRIKEIYAESGIPVADTVAEKGALMLLSLDGLMQAQIEPVSGLSVGDHVVVVLEDESEEDGRVLSVSEEKITITLSDEKAQNGEKVRIQDEEGRVLGSCELSIHSELRITGFRGVTEKLNVEKDDKVKAEDTLVTLKNEEHTSEYFRLLEQRSELEEQMERLIKLYQTCEIRARKTGEISGLTEDDETVEENEDATVSELAYIPSSDPSSEKSEEKTVEYSARFVLLGYDQGMQQDPQQPADPGQSSDPAPSDNPTQPGDPAQSSDPGQSSDLSQTGSGPQAGQPGAGGAGTGMTPSMPGGQGGSGGSGVPSGMGEATQETVKSSSSYTLSETEVYSISPKDEMTIAISVDELDIIGLHENDAVTVTLDALPGQSFEGKIETIGKDGTYENGNTKYTVTVTVSRTEQMLSGMNAGVSVVTGETKDCLTIPVESLIEKDGKTYVYTFYDEEKDLLSDLKEVSTGLSDGSSVQILEGLSSGDKVYYRYADSLIYVFNNPFKA